MRAVREVALAHGDVRSFWYAPERRLPLGGRRDGDVPKVVVVVEARPATSPDFDAIAKDLSTLLHPAEVAVRAYRGDAEERHLFRLISTEEEPQS